MDASTILHCKDRLAEQLQKAKESLKGVDHSLKKFISRSVSDAPLRTNFNKTAPVNDKWKVNRNENSRNESVNDKWKVNRNENFRNETVNDKWKVNRNENFRNENFSNNFRRRPAKVLGEDDVENIPIKKRLGPKVVHSSLSGPPKRTDYDDGPAKKPTISSCVVAKPHVVPSRNEALSVRTYTETRARDRRIFGSLIGVLKKFRQEETQLKDKVDKKALVEKKLEEAAKREKEKTRLERQKLMDIRKQRESYIKAVENNMKLVKELEQWEELQLPLFNYIRTETKPVICYLPKVHNEKTSALLEECKSKLKKLIEEKRQSVKEEVDSLISQWQNVDIDELMNKNTELLPRTSEDMHDLPSHDDADKDDVPACSSEPPETTVTNGSWNTADDALTWRSEDAAEQQQFSAKEQRIRTKSTVAISVKQEKEDDYDLKLRVKEEKIAAAKLVDDSEELTDPVQPDDDKSPPNDDAPVEREDEEPREDQPQADREDEEEVPVAEN